MLRVCTCRDRHLWEILNNSCSLSRDRHIFQHIAHSFLSDRLLYKVWSFYIQKKKKRRRKRKEKKGASPTRNSCPVLFARRSRWRDAERGLGRGRRWRRQWCWRCWLELRVPSASLRRVTGKMNVFIGVKTRCLWGGAGAMGDKKSLTTNRTTSDRSERRDTSHRERWLTGYM